MASPLAGALVVRRAAISRLAHVVALAAIGALALSFWLATAVASAPSASAAPLPPPPEEPERSPDAPGIMEQLIPGESYPGAYPTENYDIGYDEGAFDHLGRKALGFLTDLTFAGLRWVVRGGIWIVEWAFSFGFADTLARPAENVARTYQDQVIDRTGFAHFALVVAAVYGGWHMLRGRMGKGAGEFLLSVVVGVVAAIVMVNPAATMTEALSNTRQLSGEIGALAVDCDDAGCSAPAGATEGEEYVAMVRPLTASIHRAFIEQPHDLINWGRLLPPGACADVRNRALGAEEAPWGSDDQPREWMREAGCDDEYAFNRDPSAERLVASAMVVFAALVVMVLLVLVAGTLVAAQLLAVGLIAVMPFALASGVLPGGGRQMLWRWIAGVLRALAAILMMAVFLSFFLVSVNAMLAATEAESLFVRFAVLDLLVILMFMVRSRLLRAGKSLADNVGRRLEGARVGGTNGGAWMRPAAVGAAAGAGVAALWDENNQEVSKVARPAQNFVHQRRQANYQRAMTNQARASSGAGQLAAAGVGAGGAGGFAAAGADGNAGGPPAKAGPFKRAGHRVAASKPGRVVNTSGKMAKTTARLAFNSTVGAPVAAPRAAQAAKKAVSTKKAEVTEALSRRVVEPSRQWGREYRHNTAAVGRWATRSVTRRPHDRSGERARHFHGQHREAVNSELTRSGAGSPQRRRLIDQARQEGLSTTRARRPPKGQPKDE